MGLRFFRSLLAQNLAPAVTYYVRGTSTNVGGTETFNIQYIADGASTPDSATTETVNVAADGSWEFSYTGKKIYSLYGFAKNNTTITAFDFSNADDFSAITSLREAFYSSALTSLDFSGKTFQNVTNGYLAFNILNACTSINLADATFENLLDASSMFSQTSAAVTKSIDLRSATFANLTNAPRMFMGTKVSTIDLSSATFASVTNAIYMFGTFTAANLSLPNATFASVTNAHAMFSGSSGLISVSMPNATFESALDTYQMFYNCTNMTSLNLDSATFNSVTDAGFMFNVVTKLPTISMPLATFKAVTNAQGIFSQYNNALLTTISMPNATFESLTTTANANFFNGNYGNSVTSWTSKAVGVDNKSIGVTFAFYAPRLNYASFLNVANWLKDLTGGTAQTVTLSSVAWNALSSAEQNTIDGILTAKNWSRALA